MIKLEAIIDDSLTIELVKALTDEMKPEVLKDIGDIRGLRRAGIDSVRKLFESTPTDVSNATKESSATAEKYIEYAKSEALEVAKAVSAELKRAKVADKKYLYKLDITALAEATELSQVKVRKILNSVQRKPIITPDTT